jgi:hypothetical protein
MKRVLVKSGRGVVVAVVTEVVAVVAGITAVGVDAAIMAEAVVVADAGAAIGVTESASRPANLR